MSAKTEVVISAVDATKQGIESAIGGIGRLQKAGTLLQTGLAGLGGGLAAGILGAGFASTISTAIDSLDKMDEAAGRIGMTTEALSGLAYAGKLNGVEFEDLTSALGRFTVKAGEAQGGSKEAGAWFDRLGISLNDAGGKAKSSEQLFGEVADQFSNMKDGAEKSALAQEVFGKSWQVILPLLNQGSEGIADLVKEGEALGAVMSGKLAKDAADFNDNMDRLGTVSAAAGKSLASVFLPALNTVSENLLVAIKNSDGFWSALGRFVTTNPFKDHADRLRELRSEFEQIDYRLSNNKSTDKSADEARFAQLEKEIKLYEQLESAKNPEQKPTGGTQAAPKSSSGPAKKSSKVEAEEASEAAKAYAKSMEQLAKATGEADAAMLQLTPTQKSIYELMTSPAWAEMPEPWKQTAVAQFEMAYAAEAAAADQKRLNELLGDADSSKIEAARQDMLLLADAFEKGLISEEKFVEAATARLGNLKDTTKASASTIDTVITNAFGGAADAVADFAMGSQVSVGDMVNAMIRDLIRLELQMQMTTAYKGMGGFSGIVSGIASLFTGGSSAAIDTSFTTGLGSAASMNTSYAAMSFDGGGYTGAGARSGGLDGKGGFMAMLHPNETVIDHTKGQGGGGSPIININVKNEGAADGYQATATAKANGGGVDVELMIKRVMQSDMSRNGPITQGMASTFGLRRAS